MNEEPDNFVPSQLCASFRSELYELLIESWCNYMHQWSEPQKIERALLSSALIEICDLAIESMGPEECARFISTVVNERLGSLQR